MSVLFKRLALDLRVANISDETGLGSGPQGDGYWVYLKTGFADLADDPCQPTHTIHEWTVRAVLRRMRDVKPCSCRECAILKGGVK